MIYLILIFSLVLRLINLNQSLWLDEAINVNFANSLSFKELVLNYSLSDFHPPLHHIILKADILLFGTSEIAVRIPTIIFGLLTIYISYLIGKKLFEKTTALIASALLATSPLHIYYSQEARMYMLAAFLASLSVYFFISIIKKQNILNLVGFIISTVLMLYSDYLPYLMIPIYFLFIFFFKREYEKNILKIFFPAFILIILLVSPWFILFPKQLELGLSVAAASPTWANVVGSPSINNFFITFVKFTIGRISNDNNLIYAMLFAPVAIFISLMFTFSVLRTSRLRFFVWIWFFLPIILGFTLAFIIPVFAYFRFIFVLPAFYLIIASGVNTLNINKISRTFLAVALAINLVSTTIYLLNPRFHRENWKAATKYIHQQATESTIVLFESAETVAPFDYYNKGKVEAYGAFNGLSAEQNLVKNKLKDLTTRKNKIFLFQYLSGITDPQGILFEEITNQGFKNTSTKDFNGVGFVYEFNK